MAATPCPRLLRLLSCVTPVLPPGPPTASLHPRCSSCSRVPLTVLTYGAQRRLLCHSTLHTLTVLYKTLPARRPRAQIREENPRLARDSRIIRVTMDNVYEVFTTPREQTGLQVGGTGRRRPSGRVDVGAGWVGGTQCEKLLASGPAAAVRSMLEVARSLYRKGAGWASVGVSREAVKWRPVAPAESSCWGEQSRWDNGK